MEKARILIVDDDPDITEAMKLILENDGYSVTSAKDGEEGMSRIKTDRPELIILDVMMNTMSEGFGISRKLKNDSKYKHIPILMITATKEKTGLNFEAAAGDETWLPVEGFLDKPVKPAVLLNKVKTLLHEQ